MDLKFSKISKNYGKVHGRTQAAIHRFSQERYYSRFNGSTVLDIGNGGKSPEDLLGSDIANSVSSFVGVDTSVEMLNRKDVSYLKVGADGMQLPFKDNTFDYVIVNGVFHHLGYAPQQDILNKISRFINEARRVSTKEVIVYEPLVSRWIELAERFVARISGHMPVFVFSLDTLELILRRDGIQCRAMYTKKLSDFMGLFYWYQVMMAYEWLKVPAFMSPFKHFFFVIPS